MLSLTENLQNLLLKAGLSEAAVNLYLELLKKPAASKWELVYRTGLNRNAVYRAFEVLKDANLVKEMKGQGVVALTVSYLAEKIDDSQKDLARLAAKLRKVNKFLNLEWQNKDTLEFLRDQQKILETYMLMSELPYETCLDFGDLENYVPVLGGMEPVFKFRENRFNKHAKNWAICTNYGPFTQCMLRKQDMRRFKSNIDRVKANVIGKWIIFSDTNDYVMFNDFQDAENPLSVLVHSKVVADSQRMQFEQFAQNLERL